MKKKEIMNVTPSKWSEKTANDSKHRLQIYCRPSSTVRREWNRYPQEAHFLNIEHSIYRRMLIPEIAMIQSFKHDYLINAHVSEREKIAGIGNAVPPLLSKAVIECLVEVFQL